MTILEREREADPTRKEGEGLKGRCVVQERTKVKTDGKEREGEREGGEGEVGVG